MDLQNLADEMAIRDVVARFTDAVNRNDPAALAALFTDDGEWLVPGMETTVGPAAAAEQIGGLRTMFPNLVQLLHSGHVVIDGDAATGVWYLTESAGTADGTALAFTGVYRDDLVRTDAGWRFSRRTFSFLYRGKVDLAGKWYPHPAVTATV